MKRKGLSLALALVLLLAGCSGSGVRALEAGTAPPVVAAVRPELDEALGDFGLELLRQTRREGENTFLSPLSVLFCLSLCANGAAGDTLDQFTSLLAGGGDLASLNENCRSLLERYAALEAGSSVAELYHIQPGESVLSLANSLWLDRRARPEDSFVGRCTGTYEAQVFAADFTGDATRREINRWVERNTGGHIKEALNAIDPSTVLALVNAVYFEGKWQQPFDPGDTRTGRDFYREDGATGQVDLMSSGGRTDRFIGTEEEQGVLLPYRDGQLAFLALLPPEGVALTDYLSGLDGERLAGLIAGAEEAHFILRLPKFEMMWKSSLAQPLMAMGLTDAFDPGQADFSPMGADEDGNGLYLNTVIHGAGLQVDEQGTRAFSFTFGGMSGGSAMEPEILEFNRPFVYGIVDMGRGIPLFLGTFETA